MSSKADVVRALRDERKELAHRLEAIDLALTAFGVKSSSRGQPRERPLPADDTIEIYLAAMRTAPDRWWTPKRLADVTGRGVTSAYGPLKVAEARGQVEVSKDDKNIRNWRLAKAIINVTT